MRINKEKMKEFMHYVISKFDSNINRTELCNLLYLLEFNYYKINKKPLTNEIYNKYPKIARPQHFIEIKDELLEENKIIEVNDPIYVGSYVELEYSSLKPVEINFLNKEEIAIIDSIIEKFLSMKTNEINNKIKNCISKNNIWNSTDCYDVLNLAIA
ncbi:MAG: SocA family protein [Methanobrevibacter sp.]|jgi:hypothetical protein|nr:SocA family protein [Methanobrevibacter sp.]